MFYQKQPREQAYFRMYGHRWCRIGIHIHGFYELHCCTGRPLRITVAGREYVLNAGEAVLVFPYQAHSFPEKQGDGYFFTFGAELITAFAAEYANRLPRDNRFPFVFSFENISEESDLYAIKSFLYAMCSCAARLEYEELPAENRALLEKIFHTTEMYFTQEGFSLEQLAKLLGYDYGYISKYFLQKTGLRYSAYLNQRRIDHAEKMLRKGEVSNMAELAYACGYGSVRSFNRNFKLFMGCTPSGHVQGV